MTVLPDNEIKRKIQNTSQLTVEPVNFEEQLQPASLDIRLGNEFKEFVDSSDSLTLGDDFESEMEKTVVDDNGSIIVFPGDFYLANTKEYFEFPDFIEGELTGRSSVGRMGITVHQTAGIFDPGFRGEGVLEINNVGNRPVKLEPGMRIAQMVFHKMSGRASVPYNEERNRYQGQEGAVESKIGEKQ